jgi:hypothetical protein
MFKNKRASALFLIIKIMDNLTDEELAKEEHKKRVRKIYRRNFASKELHKRTSTSFLDFSCHTADELAAINHINSLICQLRKLINENTHKYYTVRKNKSKRKKYEINNIKL